MNDPKKSDPKVRLAIPQSRLDADTRSALLKESMCYIESEDDSQVFVRVNESKSVFLQRRYGAMSAMNEG